LVKDPALIIYDGDCIFCQNYARFIKLRDAVGPVELINARSGDKRVAQYWHDGYDLNEGMLFVYAGQVHYGADAVNVLANLSSTSSIFNRVNRTIFSSKLMSTTLYPLLKIGRRATLFLRGKRLIRESDLLNDE
jgi:predicted DCC family thiol-disulfide oxidoreductase YuxK